MGMMNDRAKTKAGYPRRLRSADGVGAGLRGAREERECGAEEDGGLYAGAVGGEEEISRED